MYHTFLSFFLSFLGSRCHLEFSTFLAGISRRIFIRFATGIVFIVWQSHGPTDFFSPLRHISLLHIGRLTKAYVRYFFLLPFDSYFVSPRIAVCRIFLCSSSSFFFRLNFYMYLLCRKNFHSNNINK